DDSLQNSGVLDGLAANGGEDIAGLYARLGGRSMVHDLSDHDAGVLGHFQTSSHLRIQLADLHAEVAAMHDAIGAQLLEDAFGEIAGDGQANALEAAGTGFDRGVDAHDLAFQVHERTAAV